MDRNTPNKDYIGYGALTQSALKSVLRSALQKAAMLGALPGEHHFYITFRTGTPGIQMADYLKDRFPEEMTIVIQHQYWDLEIYDDRFEIILKFASVPQHLRVPFAAVTRFFDPSVNFSLVFEESDASVSVDEPSVNERPSQTDAPEAGNSVISLDAFRRK